MNENEIKKQIRKLKNMELNIRYGYSYDYIKKNGSVIEQHEVPLIWNEFFHLNHSQKTARYTIDDLMSLDQQQLDHIIEEYWFRVFVKKYADSGIPITGLQDPELLSYLGLPYNAEEQQVKKKFHELCKKYHPDTGGDQQKFIELMQMMKRMSNN